MRYNCNDIYQYKLYYHFLKIMECILIVKLAFKFELYDHKCHLWARFQLEQIPCKHLEIV
jgi:hypothetical protein